MELMQKKGIETAGGGRNLQEARRPAFIEKKGVRVAILAYCSVLEKDFAAGPNKPGCAPLRVHTYYETTDTQPGLPPRGVTVPYLEELEGMAEDIAKAKKEAHVVVVSFHWGLHHIPRAIADYQPVAAEAAFKAGADLILGHHAHVPKAISVHNGKVCFNSLGNFIMTDIVEPGHAERLKRYGVVADEDEYPNRPMGTDSHRSLN